MIRYEPQEHNAPHSGTGRARRGFLYGAGYHRRAAAARRHIGIRMGSVAKI